MKKNIYQKPESQVVETLPASMLANSYADRPSKNEWDNDGGSGEVTDDYVTPL